MSVGDSVTLRVVPKPLGASACVHPRSARHLASRGQPGADGFWLAKGCGSDYLLHVRLSEDVPEGSLALDAYQMYNIRVAAGEVLDFRLFELPTGHNFDLVECCCEIRPSVQPEVEPPMCSIRPDEIDAVLLERHLQKQLLGQVLSRNQHVFVSFGGHDLIVRVEQTDSLELEEQEDTIGYHCYRGLCTPETRFALRTQPGADAEGPSGRIKLHGARPAMGSSAQSSGRVVTIRSNDGEDFNINKKLLRPCINLTHVVRGAPESTGGLETVDADCLNLDRAFLFLEAQHLEKELPHFPAHQLDGVLNASKALGLRSLEQHCLQRMGELESRVRLYKFDEIQRRNSAGECLILIDGMVLDVTRWLPQHPGGSTIIPHQALNVDSTRFFEVYHCTRESFLYLKELYLGELAPEDRHLVPMPPSSDARPSTDFLDQLQRYTAFRMPLETSHKNL